MAMIFPYRLPQVLDRSKTQTRQIVNNIPERKGNWGRDEVLLDENNCDLWTPKNPEHYGIYHRFPGYGIYFAYHKGDGGSIYDLDHDPDWYHVPKWIVGNTYAVQPGCGKPAAVWRGSPEKFNMVFTSKHSCTGKEWKQVHLNGGWTEARIRILRIWQEDVRRISRNDAVCEGFEYFNAAYDFLKVWASMHDKRAHNVKSDDINSVGQWLDYVDTRPAERYQASALEFEVAE